MQASQFVLSFKGIFFTQFHLFTLHFLLALVNIPHHVSPLFPNQDMLLLYNKGIRNLYFLQPKASLMKLLHSVHCTKFTHIYCPYPHGHFPNCTFSLTFFPITIILVLLTVFSMLHLSTLPRFKNS